MEPERVDRERTIAFVFGGGGGFGFGFNRGVADGLVEAGVDLYGLPLLGTSAGSICAASLVAGLSFEEVAEEWARSEDRAGSPWRHDPYDLTIPLFGGADPRTFPCELRTVAVRLPRWRRVVMTTGRFGVPDMVAASCAIPPVVQTVTIDGIRYGDGGLVSGTSVDLAPDADLLVAINPMNRPIPGMIGAVSSAFLRRELQKWKRRTGGETLVVSPTEEIAGNFSRALSDIGRIARGRLVYADSRRLGRQTAEQIRVAISSDAEEVGGP